MQQTTTDLEDRKPATWPVAQAIATGKNEPFVQWASLHISPSHLLHAWMDNVSNAYFKAPELKSQSSPIPIWVNIKFNINSLIYVWFEVERIKANQKLLLIFKLLLYVFGGSAK